jgi:hypothetical protein
VAKKILFVTYGGGHAHMIYPVIHELKKTSLYKNNQLQIQVLGLTTARGILKNNGVESFGYADYLDPQKDQDAIAWGTELAKIHHSDKNGIDRKESIAYLGLNFKDLVTQMGEKKAWQTMQEKGRHAFYPVNTITRILDDIQPDFVVTTNSPKSEAAAIAVAKSRGIETLIITDLFSGFGGYKLQANGITFLNEYAKDMWIRDDLIESKDSEFYYTGNPAFDKLLSLPTEVDPAWVEREFPTAKGRKLLLHIDAPAYLDPIKMGPHVRTEKETS